MVDVDKCIEEFLNTDEVKVYDKKYGWTVEQINHTRKNMMVLTFSNGNGVAVIDTEKFSKLPKAKQNKFTPYIS